MASNILESPVVPSISFPSTNLPSEQTLPFPIRRFSVEEYELMGQHGILGEDDNVELLEGWIVEKMVKNSAHDGVIDQLNAWFSRSLPTGYYPRVQNVLNTPDSRPEPDLSIVRGAPRDFYNHHPGPEDVVLIIEVADSSLIRDRKKRRLYARAKIPVYWIVNLEEQCVEVYTSPSGTDDARYVQEDKKLASDIVAFKISDELTLAIATAEFLPS